MLPGPDLEVKHCHNTPKRDITPDRRRNVGISATSCLGYKPAIVEQAQRLTRKDRCHPDQSTRDLAPRPRHRPPPSCAQHRLSRNGRWLSALIWSAAVAGSYSVVNRPEMRQSVNADVMMTEETHAWPSTCEYSVKTCRLADVSSAMPVAPSTAENLSQQ